MLRKGFNPNGEYPLLLYALHCNSIPITRLALVFGADPYMEYKGFPIMEYISRNHKYNDDMIQLIMQYPIHTNYNLTLGSQYDDINIITSLT